MVLHRGDMSAAFELAAAGEAQAEHAQDDTAIVEASALGAHLNFFAGSYPRRCATPSAASPSRTGSGRTKAPPCGAFAQCAEEDSNLHPVIPDQALNPVHRLPIVSIPH